MYPSAHLNTVLRRTCGFGILSLKIRVAAGTSDCGIGRIPSSVPIA